MKINTSKKPSAETLVNLNDLQNGHESRTAELQSNFIGLKISATNKMR